jgi:3-hydroxyanthranilate 3,4-dioxygenase
MFPPLTSFNLNQWIDQNRNQWGQRRIIWENSDFIAFITRGPNRRTDFHINPGDEIFYQLEGALNLHYMTQVGKHEVVVIQAGEMFLLPGRIPHSPRRGEGSWTLVVERRRGAEERDRFVWYCDQCNQSVFEASIRFDDPSDAVTKAYETMRSDARLRTCRNCGHVQSPSGGK